MLGLWLGVSGQKVMAITWGRVPAGQGAQGCATILLHNQAATERRRAMRRKWHGKRGRTGNDVRKTYGLEKGRRRISGRRGYTNSSHQAANPAGVRLGCWNSGTSRSTVRERRGKGEGVHLTFNTRAFLCIEPIPKYQFCSKALKEDCEVSLFFTQ